MLTRDEIQRINQRKSAVNGQIYTDIFNNKYKGLGDGTVILFYDSVDSSSILINESQVIGLISDLALKVPTTRLIEINGLSQDLSNDRVWNVGTITNIATHGLITGGPITTTGTISSTMNTNRLVGRGSIGVGEMEEIILGSNLSLTGNTLNASSGITPSALTKTDDTNVTVTLGGSPLTALLQATSLTLGWNGQLSLARGGTNANLTPSNGGIFYSTGTAGAILSGTSTAGQIIRSGSSSAPSWSTNTYPDTTTVGQVLYATSANVIGSSSSLYFDGTNLGIGTNTPGRILNTLAARNAALIRIQSTETGTSTISAGFEIGNSNGGSFLQMCLARCNDGLIEIANQVTGGSIVLNTDGTPGVNSGTTRLKIVGSTGEVIIGGTTITAAEFLSIQKNQNGLTYGKISNTTDGTSADTAWQISCGTTNPSNITTYVFSNSYTTSGQNVAGSVLIQANSQAIFNISQFANQPMAFRTNNTERIRINAGGDFIIENGYFYMKNTVSNTNYWKGTLVSGVLTWTDTGSTAIP